MQSPMTHFSKLLFSIVVLSLFVSSCSKDDNDKMPVLLNNYTISSTGLYPESVDYDNKNQRFVIGSFNEGNVYILHPNTGKLQLFITDSNFVGVTGVYTDEVNNRLIVASGDLGISQKSGANNSTVGKIAYLGIYNLTNGRLIKGINLRRYNPYPHQFPNGITTDQNGVIYITDSFSPCIYKVYNSYKTELFLNYPQAFAPYDSISIGLNGIAYNEEGGYFIVSKTSGNKLFRIMLNNPNQVSEVTGLSTAIWAPDGLGWTSDNQLVVIDNGSRNGAVHILTSTDGWSSAYSIKGIAIGQDAYPTGCTLANDSSMYVIYSYLGNLILGDKTQSQFMLSKTPTK